MDLIIYVYFTSAFSWSCVLVNYYIFDLSSSIQKIGVVGELFLVGFPLYILFPFTILSLVLIEINKGPQLKFLSWIGNITYSSYLLHFPLQLLFGIAVSFGILSHDFYLNPVYLFTYFIILIPLSYITFIKFERPIQRVIRDKFLQRKII
jgi:peptidoglycan/LPS O-acetylase OafA/YrhL